MKIKFAWPPFITACKLVVLAPFFMPIAVAQTLAKKAELETRMREMEKTQQHLLGEIRRNRKAVATTATDDEAIAHRREEIDKQADEIEKRIAQEAPAMYFSPGTIATTEMRAYYERLVARLEDCGTRYSPKRDGKGVYGKGIVSIGLDKGGNVLAMKVERSSADELIDNHILKLISASTPFGPIPERLRPDDDRRYTRLVVITSFEFKRDSTTAKPVDANEQCRM